MKKIRVHVEVFDPTSTTEYEDLPDNWDEMSEAERDAFLMDLAMTYLSNQAGSGAEVVEVDDDGNEV